MRHDFYELEKSAKSIQTKQMIKTLAVITVVGMIGIAGYVIISNLNHDNAVKIAPKVQTIAPREKIIEIKIIEKIKIVEKNISIAAKKIILEPKLIFLKQYQRDILSYNKKENSSLALSISKQYLAIKEVDKALEWILKAKVNEAENVEYVLLYARIHVALVRTKEAIAELEHFLKEENSAVVQDLLAEILLNEED